MLFWCISFQILGITAIFYAICVATIKTTNKFHLIPIEEKIIKNFQCYADIFFLQIFPIYKDYSFFGLEIITERILHIMQQIWKFYL